MHGNLWERLERQRTWHASPLWITVQKHGKGVALQCLRRHQGGCLHRHGTVLPRRGEPPSDCPTVLLLRPLLLWPLLLRPLLLLPLRLRPSLLLRPPRLWLPRLLLPRLLLPRLLLLPLLLLRLLLLRLPPLRLLLLRLSLAAGRRRGDVISPTPGGIEIRAALPPLGDHTLRFLGGL